MHVMTEKPKQRGNSVRVIGLPPIIHRKLNRARMLAGYASLSQWAGRMIRSFIDEQESIFGDLLTAMTPVEISVMRVIQSGAAELEQIIEESMMGGRKVRPIVCDLLERGLVYTTKQGGPAAGAGVRGARRDLYFLTEHGETILADYKASLK